MPSGEDAIGRGMPSILARARLAVLGVDSRAATVGPPPSCGPAERSCILARVEFWIIAAAVVLVVLAIAVANRIGWIDLSDKSRKQRGTSSSGPGVLGIGDEVFAPRKYEAQVELDRQSRMPAPAPIPGDGDKGIFTEGPVRIRLDADGNPVDGVHTRR